jgi:hypothetical protein
MVSLESENLQLAWLSQHSSSQEFGYKVLTNRDKVGKLYDPTLSAYQYKWIPATRNGTSEELGTFIPYDATYPIGFLKFRGRLGDL